MAFQAAQVTLGWAFCTVRRNRTQLLCDHRVPLSYGRELQTDCGATDCNALALNLRFSQEKQQALTRNMESTRLVEGPEPRPTYRICSQTG